MRALIPRSVPVTGSTHTNGFTLTQGFNNSTSGITPTFTMDQGMPPWTAPPFINPSVANGTNPAWFQGNETTKLPAYDNFYFSIERQLGSSMVLEGAYNGVMGEHLQAQLLQYNSLPVADMTKFGTVAQSYHRAEQPGRLRHRQRCRSLRAVPDVQFALGIASHRRPGPPPLPAIHRYRDLLRSGRSQRPLHLPRVPAEVPEALSRKA